MKNLNRMNKAELEALGRELRLSEKSMYHFKGGLLSKAELIDSIQRRQAQNAAGANNGT